jgi:hypothetical protein
MKEHVIDASDYGDGNANVGLNRELHKEISGLKKQLGIYRGINEYQATPPRWTQPRKSGKSHRIDTAPLSDVHLTEVVEPQEVEWVNAYNTDIAIKRLNIWAEHVIRLSRDYSAGTVCDGLVVPIVGDIISGIIHEELAKTNDQQILAGCFTAADAICAALNLFAEYYGKVFVPCVVGNHGRLSPKVSYKGSVQDNFDWMIYQVIARYFSNHKKITVHVSASQEYEYQIYDTKYRLTHGQEFRGGSGIIGCLYPTLRGNKRKRERQSVLGKTYSHLIIGHFHKAVPSVDGVIMNGAVKGYDEYAYNNNMIPAPPEQVWFSTDPDHGMTISAKVRCMSSKGEAWMKDAPEEATPRWMLTT